MLNPDFDLAVAESLGEDSSASPIPQKVRFSAEGRVTDADFPLLSTYLKRSVVVRHCRNSHQFLAFLADHWVALFSFCPTD